MLRTIERGVKKGKAWAARVQPEDQPLNIEGCCFLADGTLLLGCAARSPPTAIRCCRALELEAYFADPIVPELARCGC